MAELLLCDTKCWLSGQGASWAWLTITNPSPTLLLGSTGRLPLRRYHSLHTLHAHSRIRRFFRHPEARASCPSFALAAATASQVQAPLREGSSHR